jgi:hypothetical protein
MGFRLFPRCLAARALPAIWWNAEYSTPLSTSLLVVSVIIYASKRARL